MNHQNIFIIKFIISFAILIFTSCDKKNDVIQKNNKSLTLVVNEVQAAIKGKINFSGVITLNDENEFILEEFDPKRTYKDRGFIEINFGHLNDTILIDGYLKKDTDIKTYIAKNYSYNYRERSRKLALDHIAIIISLGRVNNFDDKTQKMFKNIILRSSKGIQKIRDDYANFEYNKDYKNLDKTTKSKINRLIPIIFYINVESPYFID